MNSIDIYFNGITFHCIDLDVNDKLRSELELFSRHAERETYLVYIEHGEIVIEEENGYSYSSLMQL